MAVGEYVVYERASKDEERLFLKIAIEVVNTVKEPSNWMKPRNPKKHAGGKPISYHFKPMMLVSSSDELSPKGLQRNGSASKMQ